MKSVYEIFIRYAIIFKLGFLFEPQSRIGKKRKSRAFTIETEQIIRFSDIVLRVRDKLRLFKTINSIRLGCISFVI